MTVFEHLMEMAKKSRVAAEQASDLRMRLVHEINERTFRLRAMDLPLEKAGEEWGERNEHV